MVSADYERKRILKKLYNQKILVYGAKTVAYQIYKAVVELYQCSVKAFYVTEQQDHPDYIEGIPVKTYQMLTEENSSQWIVVATPEVYHCEIKRLLQSMGFYNIINIDSHIEYLIMSEYYRSKNIFPLLEDLPSAVNAHLPQNDTLKIYMAKSIHDRMLEQNYQLPSYIIPIQVGKSLTEKNICSVGDHLGDNISEKNENYSELTASYFVWKNINCLYKGIFHYRRTLVFKDTDIRKVYDNDIDVILPLPFFCQEDARQQYERYICKGDMDLVWRVIKEFSLTEYDAAQSILHGLFLYNYNMLIAKEKVFNEYCSWLFPRLFRIEELSDKYNGKRQDRYLGYIGEILTSFYFMYFSDSYRIVHGEKKWLI